MQQVVDLLALTAVRALSALLSVTPLKGRIWLMDWLIAFGFALAPKHQRIAEKNLTLAYPEMGPDERRQLLRAIRWNHARLLVDFFRLPNLPDSWFHDLVDWTELPYFANREPGRVGAILATGHIGSFELTGHVIAVKLGEFHAVARAFGIPSERLLGRDRSREVALPRQVAMYLLREESISLPQIGEVLGGRDHTTVMYAIDKVTGMIEQDDRLRRQIIGIREQLYGRGALAAR